MHSRYKSIKKPAAYIPVAKNSRRNLVNIADGVYIKT